MRRWARLVRSSAGLTLTEDLGLRKVSVGRGYNKKGSTMTFIYTDGATSSLGVGYSASGKHGTFSASGTQSISSTAEIGFAKVKSTKGKLWRTKFRYGKYHEVCTNAHGHVVIDRYLVKAKNFAGGTYVSTSKRPAANYCTKYRAGTTFVKSTTAASTMSNAVTVLGLSLTGQTGYSSDAKIRFKFSKKMKLCGTGGDPGGSPGRLVSKL